jgi:hypothetical protein
VGAVSAELFPGAGVLDPRVQTIVEALGSLRADVKEATRGRLGVSATGLQGDVDANLVALLQVGLSVHGLVTLAGAKADAADESWLGLRVLMRRVGKASGGEIAAALKAVQYVCEHPQLGDMWADGLVSMSQVRQIGRLAERLPFEYRSEAVRVLAAHAPNLSGRELAHASRVLLNAVLPGWEERDHDRAETKSFLALHPDEDGFSLSGHLTVEQAGWVRTALDSHTSVIASDDARSFTERQADALVTICRTYASSDSIPSLAMARPRFIILTTASDLTAIAADMAPGDLPVTTFGDRLDPVTTRRLLSDADVVPVLADDTSTQTLAEVALDTVTATRIQATAAMFTKRRRSKTGSQRGAPPMFLRLLTTPVRPLALGRAVRIVPGWLRDVVTLRDVHCVVDGCEVPAHRCEVHHVKPWALGGNTDTDNLVYR